MTKVILISAKQGGGKTTLANTLGAILYAPEKAQVHQMTFATPLYEMHDKVLEILKGYDIDRKLVKDGPLLQMLGTDWGRKTISEDIWCTILKNRIDGRDELFGHKREQIVIVSDCRFRNEFDAFPEALRIRLECNREVRKARCSMWRDNENHPSEVDLDPYVIGGRFDLIFNTAVHTPEHCASVISHHLNAGVWIENRIPNEKETEGG